MELEKLETECLDSTLGMSTFVYHQNKKSGCLSWFGTDNDENRQKDHKDENHQNDHKDDNDGMKVVKTLPQKGVHGGKEVVKGRAGDKIVYTAIQIQIQIQIHQ